MGDPQARWMVYDMEKFESNIDDDLEVLAL